MTNTPMTSREAFELEYAKKWKDASLNARRHTLEFLCSELKEMRNGDKYGEGQDYLNFMWEGWQASQAQQASEIEALKHDLYSYMEASNGYVNEIMKQAQTIAELVEALEGALTDEHGWRDMARELIAKVKGK